MVFKGVMLTILVVILVIAMIVFFIFSIVRRKNRSVRNRLLFGGGTMLFLSLFIGVFLIYKTLSAGVYYGEKAAETGAEFIADVLSPRYIMSDPHLQKLESMQPKNVKVPGEYYTYAGFRDFYRMPLIYPYSLNAIDILDKAYLQDETGCKILLSSSGAKIVLCDIVRFRFDNRIMYAEILKSSSDSVSYVLFDFKTGELQKFEDEKSASGAIIDAGLDMGQPLYTISEYHDAF